MPRPGFGVRLIQEREEVAKYPIIFTGAEAMEKLARGQIEGTGQIVLFILGSSMHKNWSCD